MATTPDPDRDVPVKRLQLDATGKLVESPKAALFLRGPIPLNWLGSAASLPGKTLNVGIALWWLHGMAKGKPFKLTQKALQTLNVERDAASAALVRLEQGGLIRVVRKPGQRPMVSVVDGGAIGKRIAAAY
ncbi:MAG: hypothetical protein IPN06_03350 [Burkholderiales bacterium]|nr:hypothetical protein [Burkholderiales bacterium]